MNTASSLIKKFDKEQFAAFDLMPLAIGVLYILTDENGDPVDFVTVYRNKALEQLQPFIAVAPIGEPFYEHHPSFDRKWLYAYWNTAEKGIVQNLSANYPDFALHVNITCYSPAPGLCVCIYNDARETDQLQRTINSFQFRLKIILQNSVDYLFDFDCETASITDNSGALGRKRRLPKIKNIPDGLIELGLAKEECRQDILDMLTKIKEGFSFSSCVLEFRPKKTDAFQWYRFSLHPFYENDTEKPLVIGYLKNIHTEISKRRLEFFAHFDELTQIHNLRAGKQLIENILSSPDIHNTPTENTMFLLDIDNFKNINDVYGHYMGDVVLKKFARVLQTVFRKTDIVYRMGGDEFIVFTPCAGGNLFVERICNDILRLTSGIPDISFPVSVSIGVATSSDIHATYDDYYQHADKALYVVKNTHKGGHEVVYF